MDLTLQQMRELRAAAKKMVVKHSLSSIELSELVWKTRYAQIDVDSHVKVAWEHWGYDSWEEYLQTELQMSLVTARAHVRVWDAFGIALKGKWDKRKAMPHPKMSALAELAMKSKDINALLDEASELTLQGVWDLNPQKSRKRRTTLLLTKKELGQYKLYVSAIRVLIGAEDANRGEIVVQALEHYLKALESKKRRK